MNELRVGDRVRIPATKGRYVDVLGVVTHVTSTVATVAWYDHTNLHVVTSLEVVTPSTRRDARKLD